MKILKKHGLTFVLLAALVVTFTLGIVFALPAKTVSAADDVEYGEPVYVSSEKELKDTVANAGEIPTKIILDGNIEMNSITSKVNKKFYELTINRKQVIELDLAGHILSLSPASISTRGVIQNYGTLSIVDSSGDYSGAVVSNGYIHSEDDGVYWDASRSVIDNYGALTLNANIRMGCPAPTASGTDGYFNRICDIAQSALDSHLIRNLMEPPMGSDPDQTFYVASVTINGGNFDLDYSSALTNKFPYVMNHFILIRDAQLTINGGTFRNSQTHCYEGVRPWNPGFLVDLGYLSNRYGDVNNKKLLEDGYRHVNINITGGDFADKNLLTRFEDENALLYLAEYNKSEYGDTFSVSISGGTFPMDLSVYTDAQHMMIEEELSKDNKQYIVVPVDDNFINGYAVAKLELDGETPTLNGYYGSFEGAWSAAQTRAAMGQSTTIQLLKNIETKILFLNGVDKDVSMTIDLNGKEMKISVDGQNAAADNAFICADNSTSKPGVTTLVVCDTTEEQNGAINFVYPQKYDKYGSIYITQHMKFVLESGTLKRTGGGFNAVKGSNEHKKSIFYLVKGSYYQSAVTIKGGNILSMLSGGDQGHLISHGDDSGHNDDEWYNLANYTGDINIAFADDLSSKSGRGYRFSWNLSPILPEGVTGTTTSDGSFVVTYTQENENYMVGTTAYSTLADAIAAAQAGENHTVVLLRDRTEEGDVELPDGIKLDLNQYLNYTFAATKLSLNTGSAVMNGTVQANIVVKGAVTFSALTVKGDITVEESGKLVIGDGTYDGTLSAAQGGKLSLIGGKYLATGESYIPYIQAGFGAASENGGYRTVKAGIASDAALAWYESKGATEAGIQTAAVGDTYYINNENDFLYFTSIVNSGKDTFGDDTIILNSDLNFGDYTFLPAGAGSHAFNGTIDGNNKTMSNIVMKEFFAGIIGESGSACTVNDLTIKDSTFTAGSGYLDDLMTDSSWLAAGSVVGSGFLKNSSGITIDGCSIGTEAGYTFIGGLIGHTYSSVQSDNLTVTDTSVRSSWKSGGVVGYVEGELTLKEADIKGLGFEGEGFFPSGVLAGDLNGGKAEVTNATIDCPDVPLNGVSSSKADVKVDGPKTDIHVESLGNAGSFNFTLDKNEETGDSAQLQVGSSLPENVTIKDSEGNEVKQEPNPDGDGVIMQASPKNVELFYGHGEIRGSYDTLQAAIDAAEEGERIYLKADLAEASVTVGTDKVVTINLYGHTLTGNITVEGALILENGTVKGSITVSGGTLTLAVPALGEDETAIKELTITATEGKAIDGTYTVEKNGNQVCVQDGETEVKLTGEHAFTKYVGEGNRILLVCEFDDEPSGQAITVTTEKTAYPYIGTAYTDLAVVTSNIAGFDLKDVIVSYLYSATAEGAFAVADSVLKVGFYRAQIEYNDVTAFATFSISKTSATISGITAITQYTGDKVYEGEAAGAVVTLANGTTMSAAEIGLTVIIRAELSDYSVGKQFAKIVSISVAGDALTEFELAPVGNQLFAEVDVTPTTLTVRVNGDGSVSYVGFVGGEDESVLGGNLKLDYTDNGDGTSTVTPSGLESNNYRIVYEVGVVRNSVLGNGNNTLWIVLAVLGAVAAAVGMVAVVYAVRRKKD